MQKPPISERFWWFNVQLHYLCQPNQVRLETTTITQIITNTIATSPSGTHNGAVTHHQDQLMTLVSLRTRNVMNNIPQNPFPPIIVVFSLDILLVSFLPVIVNCTPNQICCAKNQYEPNYCKHFTSLPLSDP